MEQPGSVTGSEDIYQYGPLKAGLFSVRSSSSSAIRWWKKGECRRESPPPVLIAAPEEAGEYPVVMLQHGWLLDNTFYGQLMTHIASHGFIVVAPQMYLFSFSDATNEIFAAAAVIDWLPQGLAEEISSRRGPLVKPDLEKVALVGHSRGGKVVFGVGTGVAPTTQKFLAIAGLDPVDGSGEGNHSNPPILQGSMNLKVPTLVVGARLGSEQRIVCCCIPLPASARAGVSHDAFFDQSPAPSFHFVAANYGHMDYLDYQTEGLRGWVSSLIGVNGPSREPMRRFSGGVVIAFLRAYLLKDKTQLEVAILNPSLAPVELEEIRIKGSS